MGHPRFGQPIPCRCIAEAQRQRLLERAQRASNLSPRLLRQQFATYAVDRSTSHRRALEAAQAFAARPQGWLVFAGPTGQGKTHLLAAIANALLARLPEGAPMPLYVVVPDWLDYLRAGYDGAEAVGIEDRMQQAREVPVLLLDDLGAERRTEWGDEKLYQLLNVRYNEERPTVLATNCPLDQGASPLEPRILSRMSDRGLSVVCTLAGEDYRISTQRERRHPSA